MSRDLKNGGKSENNLVDNRVPIKETVDVFEGSSNLEYPDSFSMGHPV